MGHGPDALHTGRGAGCPGVGPDVRGFPRRRMSGRWGRMSGLAGSNLVALWNGGVRIFGLEAGCPGARDAPDVRAGRRMSGPCRLGHWLLAAGDTSRGRMSGPGPDVRARAGCPGPGRCIHFIPSSLPSFPRGWCSSSSFVVFRQYLCMHTRGVSSSIPSSKGSSEHV